MLRLAAARCASAAAALSGRAPQAVAAEIAAEASTDLGALSVRLRRLAVQARNVPHRETITTRPSSASA